MKTIIKIFKQNIYVHIMGFESECHLMGWIYNRIRKDDQLKKKSTP